LNFTLIFFECIILIHTNNLFTVIIFDI
jgi:hypothetical protein